MKGEYTALLADMMKKIIESHIPINYISFIYFIHHFGCHNVSRHQVSSHIYTKRAAVCQVDFQILTWDKLYWFVFVRHRFNSAYRLPLSSIRIWIIAGYSLCCALSSDPVYKLLPRGFRVSGGRTHALLGSCNG